MSKPEDKPEPVFEAGGRNFFIDQDPNRTQLAEAIDIAGQVNARLLGVRKADLASAFLMVAANYFARECPEEHWEEIRRIWTEGFPRILDGYRTAAVLDDVEGHG